MNYYLGFYLSDGNHNSILLDFDTLDVDMQVDLPNRRSDEAYLSV